MHKFHLARPQEKTWSSNEKKLAQLNLRTESAVPLHCNSIIDIGVISDQSHIDGSVYGEMS